MALTGASASRATWLVAAGVAAALAEGPARLVALAGVTTALAASFLPHRHPVLGAAVGAAAVNGLLRLGEVGGHGVATVLAVAAAAPLVVSGLRHTSRRVRHSALAAAAAVVVIVAVLTVASGVAVLLARPDLQTGLDEARAGLDLARDGEIDLASERFASAEEALDRGVSTLGAAWLAPARGVPVVGQHVSAGHDLSRVGRDALGAAGDAAVIAADDALGIQDGAVDLGAVADAEVSLSDALAALDDAMEVTARHDSPWLVAPLTERIDELRDEVVDARGSVETAALATRVAPGMLGADGPRRYLLLFTTPAETRNLGGFVGNWALMSTDEGRVALERSGRAQTLSHTDDAPHRTLSGPADFLDRYARYAPSVHLRNVTASPDFPTVGQVSAELFPQAGIGPVDGVIAIDPAALAALLSLTGPVTVPQINEPLDAEELERFLLFEQYEMFPDLEKRESVLDALIEGTFHRFLDGADPSPTRIREVLGPVVAEERLLVWSPDDDDAALLSRVGLSGAFPRPVDGAEVLSVRTANAGGNKLDVYLRRAIRHEASIDPDTGALAATTTLALSNRAPEGLPTYVLGGDDPDPAPRVNRQLVSLYTPHRLEQVRIDGGVVPVEAQVELGWNVYTLFVVVPPDATVSVEFDLVGTADPDAYRMVWDAQPVFRADELAIAVRSGDRTLVEVDRQVTEDLHLPG